MVRIVSYCPELESLHYDFASRYWSKRKRTTPEYIYWKFRGQPGKRLDAFILAIDGSKVVGQLGLVPCSLLVGEQRLDAQWACDLMVDTEYRGKGVGKQLYDFAFTLKKVTLGSDPSAAANISMRRAGFRSLSGPVKFLFPMYLGEITTLKGINIKFLDRIPNPFITFLHIWRIFRKDSVFSRIDSSEYLRRVGRPPDENTVLVDHNNGFAEWRFSPFKNYYSGINTQANGRGAVLSVMSGTHTNIVTEQSSKTIPGLIDIASTAVHDALSNRARRVKLLAHTKREKIVFGALGFVRFRTKTNIIYYSTDPRLAKELEQKTFYYTYMDSDENI